MLLKIPKTYRNGVSRYRCLSSYSINDQWNSVLSFRKGKFTGVKDGTLEGTTYIVKDNIVTKNEVTSCASQMLSNYKSPFDATVVRLLNEAGLELTGKANLDEFGMGSSNTNSYYGPVINPNYEDERIAGGSSGGSAVAVAGDLATFSLGTDTGGSVRLPASYCNIIGFKPTYGRISRWGVVAYAQTLDTVGILSKNLNTITKVYDALNKYDSKDITSLSEELRNRIPKYKKEKLTIGIPIEFNVDGLSTENKEAWIDALSKFQSLGHELKTVSIPTIKKLLLAYYTLVSAEAASNLSRYDGVRYGYSDPETKESVDNLISLNRSTALGPEVQRRIILGNYTLSSESGNHYHMSGVTRKMLVEEFDNIFNLTNVLLNKNISIGTEGCDLLVSPTSIGSPPTIEEYKKIDRENFLNSYLNDILTVPASLAGIPAISVPFQNSGIQIIGQFGDDYSVLKGAEILMS